MSKSFKIKTYIDGKEKYPGIYGYPPTQLFITIDPIVYDIDTGDRKLQFSVPRNFPFDGASVPKTFWVTTGHPLSAPFIRAALLHDCLYRYNEGGHGKAMADKLFYEILRADGVGWYTAKKMYRAVCWFGGSTWRKWRRLNDGVKE